MNRSRPDGAGNVSEVLKTGHSGIKHLADETVPDFSGAGANKVMLFVLLNLLKTGNHHPQQKAGIVIPKQNIGAASDDHKVLRLLVDMFSCLF